MMSLVASTGRPCRVAMARCLSTQARSLLPMMLARPSVPSSILTSSALRAQSPWCFTIRWTRSRAVVQTRILSTTGAKVRSQPKYRRARMTFAATRPWRTSQRSPKTRLAQVATFERFIKRAFVRMAGGAR